MGNPVLIPGTPYQEGNPLTFDLAGRMDFSPFLSPALPFRYDLGLSDDAWKNYRFGFGGEVDQPESPSLPDTSSGSGLPQSPEETDKTDMQRLLDYLREREERQNDPEVLAGKNKAALDLMNAIGEKQMEYGWKSNLIGFALKELPRLMTEPARRRNRYLDDMVLNSPSIRQNAASMFTGGSTGNYTMGI